MLLSDFANWAKNQHNLDCYENNLFESSLNAVYKELENTNFNGIPFFKYYTDEELYKEFLTEYVSRIEMLLNSIPKSNSSMSLNIHGVNLNDYFNIKNELLNRISSIKLEG